MSDRLLFVSMNCPHCRKYIGIVEDINMKLAPDKQIERININGFDTRIQKYIWYIKKYGTPFFVMDGYAIIGMTTEKFVRGFLNAYLKKAGDL